MSRGRSEIASDPELPLGDTETGPIKEASAKGGTARDADGTGATQGKSKDDAAETATEPSTEPTADPAPGPNTEQATAPKGDATDSTEARSGHAELEQSGSQSTSAGNRSR